MELYHVINRGVEGRAIFADSQDYARFVHDLYEFNDSAPADEYARIALSPSPHVGRTTSHMRQRLVNIHGWILMENHYHLLLSERQEGGLTRFLRKLSGYARYFNERHARHGTLFQGRSKRILVDREAHFLYILHYIHLNALDYLPGAKNWRVRDKGSIPDVSDVLTYLKGYRWSSYLDYCGVRNFPSIITTSLFEEGLGGYRKSLETYLQERSEYAHPFQLEIE